ncbi:MAG TPA: hypothetical protein VM364_18810 [Vicinamibacterales bacterium]|nr:hypothetical protein [Vicinamibacterales bacterium]
MQPLLPFAACLVVVLLPPGVSAQTRGTVGAGVTVSAVVPASAELTTEPRVRPTLRRMPARGWGVAMALNWFDAEVDAASAGGSGRLGRLATRPLMAGIGYTAVSGRVGVSPSVVAGPALNTLAVDQRLADTFAVAGSGFETRVGSVSFAVRPGLSVTYALAPRLALTGFGGYLFNQPEVTLATPTGERRIRWNGNGVVVSGGIVVTF